MRQLRQLNNHSMSALAFMLVGFLIGTARFRRPLYPQQRKSNQVSMPIPTLFDALIRLRVLPSASSITGNSNPILWVHKKIIFDGTLGN